MLGSGYSVLFIVMMMLSILLTFRSTIVRLDRRADALDIARRTVQSFAGDMLAATGGFGGLWQAAAFLEAPHTELAILGAPAERAPLERAAARHFLPFTALAFTAPGGDLPVLEARPGGGQAYVCVDRACQLPTHDPATLERQLGGLGGN
jgi:uncharacterized protein YyaL (SSP411 family)